MRSAGPWQVLASQRVFYAAEPVAAGKQIDELALKGFSRPVRVFDINEVTDHERRTRRRTEKMITDDLEVRPTVADLDDSARQNRFAALQERMQQSGGVEAGPGR